LNTSEQTKLAAQVRSANGFEPIPPLHSKIPHITEAYEIQTINRNIWLQAGRKQTGYKVAFTTLESQRLFGTKEPVYGTLFKDMEFANGSTIPEGKLANPKLEGEIVMELSQDLTGDAFDEAAVRASIGAIYPALEIPDSSFSGKFNAVDMAAENAAAAGYVLGERFPLRADFDLSNIGLTMSKNGRIVDSGTSANCMGSPLNVLVWLANALAIAGQQLRAGQIVFAGSLIPIIPVQPGDSFEATVEDLGKVRCQFDTA